MKGARTSGLAQLILETVQPRAGRGSWHGGPTAVPLSRYDVPFRQGKRWTMGEMILGIAQHDAYHTGQIQLLKRLWSAKRR